MQHTSTISTVLIHLLNSNINQAEDSFQEEVLLACSVASISSPLTAALTLTAACHRCSQRPHLSHPGSDNYDILMER